MERYAISIVIVYRDTARLPSINGSVIRVSLFRDVVILSACSIFHRVFIPEDATVREHFPHVRKLVEISEKKAELTRVR